MFSIRRACYLIHLILLEYYLETRDDTLADFSQSFTPYLGGDEVLTSDPAFWGDWVRHVQSQTSEEMISFEQAKRAVIEFIIEYYHTYDDHSLDWLIERFENLSENDPTVQGFIVKALNATDRALMR